MGSREEIIRQLYKNYKFIEEDFSKFRKMSCLSSVEDFRDGVKKLSKCVRQEVINHGFVDTFRKIERAVEIENALNIIYIMSAETGYVIQGADIMAIANVEEYKECFDAFIKQNGIKDVKSLNNREMANEFLKNILTIRLNSKEIKEYIEEEGRKKRLKSRKPINYGMPFSKEQIDEVISTLSDEERSLIKNWENGDELPKNAYCKIRSIKTKIEEKLKQKEQDGEMLTSSTEELQKETSQQKPPVNNNPPDIEPPKPVFSDVIKRIQSKQKWDNVVTGIKEEKEEIKDKIVDENMPNKYYIVAYKGINADPSVIAAEIEKLTKREINLIERKGRITLGVYDKILTPIEEKELKKIINKLKSKLEPQKEKIEETPAPQEDHVDLKKEGKKMPKESSKEKTKKSPISKKRGPRPKSIYELVPVSRQKLDQYLTEELSDEELKIVTTREKLIRENRFDEIPKEYKPIIAEIVRKAKKRFGLNDNKPILMKEIIKNVKKLIKIKASKEEIEVVLGTLSSKDLGLLNKKGSRGRLTSEKYMQRQVVIKKIEAGIRKQRGQEKPQEEKIEETPKTHKTSVERKKLQDYFPGYSKEKLAELIEKISDDDKELIKAMEEGKVLPRTDLNRYYRVIHALQEGRIPAPRTRRADRHLVIETQEEKGYHVKESIYVLIPIDRDILDEYIEKNLDDNEKNIVRTRERIINEKSSERLTQWAYDKFARILKKIREALIPEEDRDEISKKVSQGKRIPIHKRFSSFSKEEIDAEFACLSEEEKKLIEKSENGEPIPRCKRGKLRYALNKMEKNLYKNRIQTEKTPISREQLSEELKQASKTVNQDVESNDEEQTTVPPEEIIPEPPTTQTTAPQEIADDERIMADYSRSLLAAATKSAKVAERVGAINLAMISLRYGTEEGVPKRTSEEIAKFLEIDLETVEKTITDTLKEIYDVIVESLGNNNTNSGKIFVKTDGETREE